MYNEYLNVLLQVGNIEYKRKNPVIIFKFSIDMILVCNFNKKKS